MVKKILVFLAVFGLILGISGFALADTEQGAEAGVSSDLALDATPNPIDFGSTLKPGSESIQSVTLTPGTSDLDISVGITGASFIVDMMADRDGDLTYSSYNLDSFMMTANTPMTFNTKVMVPVGTVSGTYTGTITYTVLEHVPL
ncbi:hypothetical protein HY212_06815 [Candidatus Pacearchaeota archaeon]|nr:hypothetical protein [Candidatus Pacearchaeota archaeon]